MKLIAPSLALLALLASLACGGQRPTLPTAEDLAAVQARALVAVGEASAALETAASVSARVRARLDASPLPDRVLNTLRPALDEFDEAIFDARQKLETAATEDAINRLMAPVVTARTKLATLLRLYESLADVEALLHLIPARGR
jgi:hypothetical protein